MKGYSSFATSTPRYAVPSSWREVTGSPASRLLGNTERLDELLAEARRYRSGSLTTTTSTTTSSSNVGAEVSEQGKYSKCDQPTTSPLRHRKSNMRKSIKHLFSTAPKFQKTLKRFVLKIIIYLRIRIFIHSNGIFISPLYFSTRSGSKLFTLILNNPRISPHRGVYLSCLIFHEDKILLTNEENLPIIEVDDNFNSANLQADFNWLMKVLTILCETFGVKTILTKSLVKHFR